MSEHSTSDFVKKLYLILDDREFQELIRWGPGGDFFIVKDVTGFSNIVLPMIYKHSNFASFVRQLNKYDFHKIKAIDEDSLDDKTWAFRHPDFRRDGRNALENIKRKSRCKCSAATALDPLAASSSQLVEIQNNKINVLTDLRTLDRSNHEIIREMIGFQRQLTQQDGLFRALLQYLWRDNIGTSSGDLPDSDIAQATEFSRQARASGIYFPAIESGGARNPPLGVSGTSATMDSFDLAGNEELQAWLQGKTIPRLNHPLPISIDNIPRDVPGATPANLDEVGLENEVVLPTSTGPISDARSSHTDSLSLSAGDAHTGLEVFTVRDLMPRGNADTSNGSFESDAFIRNQEVSSNSAQTLSVRRSTFVPGWAMPPRVLLVDDDAITRKLSSNLLKIFGCTTDVAVDGLSAVNKMNLKKYDLVLMDIVMPKMDGISATSMIRKFDPQTPIISMTSSSRPTDIMTYFSSGMNDILPKPFTRDGLLDVLKKHLAHLTVIKQQMVTSMVPRPPNAPPSNNMGFGNASGGGTDLLASMAITDEEYNRMLMDILGADGSTFDSTKRQHAVDGEDGDDRGGKRSRFEVLA
ncbi:hypothetical protein B0H13DRAFT_1601453 [Mycena leptocephala]|nr:hypothetical protein B0H13DRAFT_1601453 [Mycena leptocephala]